MDCRAARRLLAGFYLPERGSFAACFQYEQAGSGPLGLPVAGYASARHPPRQSVRSRQFSHESILVSPRKNRFAGAFQISSSEVSATLPAIAAPKIASFCEIEKERVWSPGWQGGSSIPMSGPEPEFHLQHVRHHSAGSYFSTIVKSTWKSTWTPILPQLGLSLSTPSRNL